MTIPQSLRDSSLCSREPVVSAKFQYQKIFYVRFKPIHFTFALAKMAPLSKGSCRFKATEGLSNQKRGCLF